MHREIEEAVNRANRLAEARPELKGEIIELYELVLKETAEDGSWRDKLDRLESSLRKLEERDESGQ